MSLWFILVFILKQKTAYEMRISDWSSDVCSSDLVLESDDRGRVDAAGHRLDQVFDVALLLRPIRRVIGARRIHGSESRRVDEIGRHTSELQSLMRISYAVFCLKKKKNHIINNIYNHRLIFTNYYKPTKHQ